MDSGVTVQAVPWQACLSLPFTCEIPPLFLQTTRLLPEARGCLPVPRLQSPNLCYSNIIRFLLLGSVVTSSRSSAVNFTREVTVILGLWAS